MQSRLVTRKNEIERELRRGVRDPQRRQYLIARLLQIENDIRAIGFSELEKRTILTMLALKRKLKPTVLRAFAVMGRI
jgi:hypothetical protein